MNLDRTIQPDIQPISSISLLAAEKQVLENDIALYLLEGGDQEIMSLQLFFPAGRAQETKAMVSFMMSALFKEGTKNKTAKQVHEIIDFYGANLSVSTSYDYMQLQLVCLTKHLEPLLNLLVELFNEPCFSEEELEIKRQTFIQKLKVNLEKTDYLAQRLYNEKMFGEAHPYGYSSSIEKYKALTIEDVEDFFTQMNLSEGFALLAGNLTGNIKSSVVKALESLQGSNVSKKKILPEIQNQPGKYIQRKEGAQQASVRVGQLMPNKKHKDYSGLLLLNTILGGYFGSRLMSNIREDKGYTYGIYSALSSFKEQGYFFIATDVGADQAENTLKEIFFEIEELKTKLVGDDELQLVKNYLMGKFLGQVDGPFAQASVYARLLSQDETREDYSARIEQLKTISAEEVMRLANHYFNEDEMVIVVV